MLLVRLSTGCSGSRVVADGWLSGPIPYSPVIRVSAILLTEILLMVCGAVVITAGMTLAVSRFGGILIHFISG